MRYSEVDKYIQKNGLLKGIEEKPGIYAITVDNKIVYVGMSKNLYQRCSQHIYNTQNAMFNQEQKYLLLLSAHLGGHNVDCLLLEYCDIELLRVRENWWIEDQQPILNILTPSGKQDITELKIEDVIADVHRRRLETLKILGMEEK